MAGSPLAATVSAPVRSTPAPGSILASVPPVIEPDDRWEAGLQWVPGTAAESVGVWSTCTDGTPEDLPSGRPGPVVEESPLVFVTSVECSTPTAAGGASEELRARLDTALDGVVDAALSREVWYGEVAGGRALIDATDLLTASNNAAERYPFILALGLLQTELGAAGIGRGVIHATPTVAAWGFATNLFRRVAGNRVEDQFGNLVLIHPVPGVGGPDAGEDSSTTPDEVSWMYVTSAVALHLSPPQTWPSRRSEAIDTRVNTETWYASRVGWLSFDDAVHAGVRVDLAPTP